MHSSPFLGVAGTEICCRILLDYIYNPLHISFFFFFSLRFGDSLEVEDFQLGHVGMHSTYPKSSQSA